MNYEDCNFDDLADIAKLYGLSYATAQTWAKKSVSPVPWHNPYDVLDWYRVAFQREPGKRVRDRVEIIGPQMVRCEESHPGSQHGAAGDPQTREYRSSIETNANRGDLVSKRDFFEELCADLGNARTLARIASEEREAYDLYRMQKDRELDSSAQLRRWQDLTKTKREWAKTEDAVQLAFKLLRNWLRSEWEVQWKELRTALDGRRMGMDARGDLISVADDPVEWRRIWDMHMERVILEILEK